MWESTVKRQFIKELHTSIFEEVPLIQWACLDGEKQTIGETRGGLILG